LDYVIRGCGRGPCGCGSG